jgi:succinate dehydrogenase/fumarate reductase cytochrome b subunit
MLSKILIIIVFLIIVYNLFAALKYLFTQKHDEKKLLSKLKWRIGLSMFLFIMIILGFLSGVVQLHTL